MTCALQHQAVVLITSFSRPLLDSEREPQSVVVLLDRKEIAREQEGEAGQGRRETA